MTPRGIFYALGSCSLLLSATLAADEPRDVSPDDLRERARSVLAQTAGVISIPGLSAPVEVLRDAWGIPHIYAQNQDDLFFAQGFVSAQDRLFQIDLWRRIAIGETAAVVGEDGIAGDRFARLVRYRGDLQTEWTSYSPDTERIATAFTAGINAYIDHLGSRWPVEFQQLGYPPARWQPSDVLGRMSGIIMSRNFRSEVDRARLMAAVGVERARQLAPTDPPRPFDLAPGLDPRGFSSEIVSGYEAATRSIDWSRVPPGSNNWVVDGTLSRSGKPLLAGDPHRAITLPALRYLVHLHAPGWNVIGAGEPALPGVALGHNEHVAWALTIVGNDQSDLYVETLHPDDPRQYRVGDRWEAMQVIRETIEVRDALPLELELCFTRHGPVIYEDLASHRAYVLRWVGAEPGTAAYLASLGLDRARNATEFRQAAKAWLLPSENLVYADVEGNIGWVAAAMTPIRRGWDGLLPVPGASGEYEWQGFLDAEKWPQLHNPPSHAIITANHNILPSGYPHEIAYEFATPYRFLRSEQRLKEKPKFDLNDFQSMQYDVVSLPGQVLARVAGSAALRDSELKPYAALVARWNGEVHRDSAAAALYVAWMDELLVDLFRGHVPDDLLGFVSGGAGPGLLVEQLERPTAAWFGSEPEVGRDRLLESSLRRAVRRISTRLGDDASDWSWGALHQARFTHPLSTMGSAYARAFNLPSVATSGDVFTPHNARHDRQFNHIHGASFRLIVDLADWDRGVATSTPGQSGQPESKHYGDLLELWHQGKYFPLAFSRAKVESVTTDRLILQPAP